MIQSTTEQAETSPRSPTTEVAAHTPTPWFVSGVRFRMNGGEWQSVNRYDEALKRDENVACVGYDPRNGAGRADAHFIVKAVNSHDTLVAALEKVRSYNASIAAGQINYRPHDHIQIIDEALATVKA